VQLAVLTDTLNHIHIACPEWYGKEPHICRTFDRVEDRRFFLDGDTMVTTVAIPGSFTLRGEIIPIDDGVKLRIAVTNLSEQTLPESPAIVCIQCAAAPSFADPLLERYFYVSGGEIVYFQPPYEDVGARLFSTIGHQVGPREQFWHNPEPDFPFIGMQSTDGRWVLGHSWKTSRAIWGNCHPAIACLHADPMIAAIAPGDTFGTFGVLYVMQGTPAECVNRFRQDFLE
jgi:hypothetical protein